MSNNKQREYREEARKRLNIILGKLKFVCNKYVNENGSEHMRHSLEKEMCRVVDPYVSSKYIEAYNLDVSNAINPEKETKEGKTSFFFGITYKGVKDGTKNTFKRRSI